MLSSDNALEVNYGEADMAIDYYKTIRRASALLLHAEKAKNRDDITALNYCASEARRLSRDLEVKFPPPKPHTGPNSGKSGGRGKTNSARESAAGSLSALEQIYLFTMNLGRMTVFQLEKVAKSASETAAIAEGLLEKIGVVQDKTVLVRDTMSEKAILGIISRVVGRPVKEYRDLASLSS